VVVGSLGHTSALPLSEEAPGLSYAIRAMEQNDVRCLRVTTRAFTVTGSMRNSLRFGDSRDVKDVSYNLTTARKGRRVDS